MKKVIKIIGIALATILVLIILAIGAVFLFQDKIIEQVRQEVNKGIEGEVAWQNAGVQIFRTFPDMGVELERLSLTGRMKDTIATVENVAVGVDFWSMISGDQIKIKKVILDEPHLLLYLDSLGKANYDIFQTAGDTDTTGSDGSDLYLEKYEINNGYLVFIDEGSEMEIYIPSLNHSGSGNFSASEFILSTETAADSVLYRQGGITYLNYASLKADVDLAVNSEEGFYILDENIINVNELMLRADGDIRMPKNGPVVIDLAITAPSTDISQVLSLIPAYYGEDFDKLETGGSMALEALIKGEWNLDAEDELPALHIELKIADGYVKSPDLPSAIEDLQVNAVITKEQGSLNKLIAKVSEMTMRINNSHLRSSLIAHSLFSDSDFKGEVTGEVNLSDIMAAVPVEDIDNLSGQINLDIAFDILMSEIKNGIYKENAFIGFLNGENIHLQVEPYPDMRFPEVAMEFDPDRWLIEKAAMEWPGSRVSFNGAVDNALGYFLADQTMLLNLNVEGDNVNTNPWIFLPEFEEGTAASSADVKPLDNIAFEVDAKVGELIYDVYEFHNVSANVTYRDEFLTVTNGKAIYQEAPLRVRGELVNMNSYLAEEEVLRGTFNIDAGRVDLLQLAEIEGVETGTDTERGNSENMELPSDMDLVINVTADKVMYGDFDFYNATGKLLLKEKTLHFQDMIASAAGGQMRLNGFFNTIDPQRPMYELSLGLENSSISEIIQESETVAKFAPILRWMNGLLNLNLAVAGSLDEKLNPIYETLDAEGFMQTLNVIVNDIPYLSELANKLNYQKLTGFQLENTKNWFTIQDGLFTLKPTTFTARDMQMTLQGSHAIDQRVNYELLMHIPKRLLDQMPGAGNLAGKADDLLADLRRKSGINVTLPDTFLLGVNIGGSLTNPQVNLGKLRPGGAADKTIQQDIEDQLRDEVDHKKEEVRQRVEEEVRDTRDTIREKANEEARKRLRDLIKPGDDTTSKEEDPEERAEKEIEKTKNKFKNIFGKKDG